MQSAPDHPASQVGWSGLPTCGDWVGSSAEAARIRGEIATASLSADPVVIVGEGGTGRRLAAELIHRSSHSGASPAEGFVPIETGSVPAGRLAPHLEAVVAGSSDNGSVPRARTLYLSGMDKDRLGDISSLVGSLGIRLIASTAPARRPPANGRRSTPPAMKFPGVTTIQIPPLRERKIDISPLALRFLTDACERCGVGPYGISGRMIAAYHDYDWPGNAAELQAVIESAVSTAALARFRGRVLPDSFCVFTFMTDRTGRSLREMLHNVEKNILEQTLFRVGGNQTQAARILQVNTTTLHEKLKRYGLLPVSGKRAVSSPPERIDTEQGELHRCQSS